MQKIEMLFVFYKISITKQTKQLKENEFRN
jgi:hypothetical protein